MLPKAVTEHLLFMQVTLRLFLTVLQAQLANRGSLLSHIEITKIKNHPAGANCTTGGVKLEFGLDTNGNDTLDGTEINSGLTKYVCNGSNSTSSNTQGIRLGFASSNTWICPAGVNQITVELWGAGGGGGGSSYLTLNCAKSYLGGFYGGAVGNYGGNGGSGGYTKQIVNVTPGQAYTVVIGAGGIGGTTGNSSSPSGIDGGNGGISNFNSIISAFGGTGGQGAPMTCGCPGQVGSNCTGIPNPSNGSSGAISNFNWPANPNAPSYIPSSYITLFPSCCAGGGSGGSAIVYSATNYGCLNCGNSGSDGVNGYCVITY